MGLDLAPALERQRPLTRDKTLSGTGISVVVVLGTVEFDE
jgi:hypothetical protein